MGDSTTVAISHQPPRVMRMLGLQSHEPFAAEPTFDRFVAAVGGARVDCLVPKGTASEQADYFFSSAAVIAELKTIEENFPFLPEYQDRLARLRSDQVSRGLMSLGQFLRGEPLPAQVHKETLRLYRPRLSRVLGKANRQIKATRSLLAKPDAAGLLLVANSGLTGLEPAAVMSIFCDLLAHRYSGIDGFVYFTLNQYAVLPDRGIAYHLWTPAYAPKAPIGLSDFVNALGRQWGDFLEKELGPFIDRRESTTSSLLDDARMLDPDDRKADG